MVELGTIKRYKDWISWDTIRFSIAAKEARLSDRPEYQRLRREATRSRKKERHDYWQEKANNTETGASACHFRKPSCLI